MRVPFVDLSREGEAFADEASVAVSEVMRSGRYLYGAQLAAFEKELAAWFGVAHAVGVASGTDAVEIALRATGFSGAEVTLPAFTAVPCINAVEAAGCIPKLVDVGWDGNTSKATTLSVSMFGEAAEPGPVEDIAHAMGAIDPHSGKRVGTRGLAGAVSFYPTKVLGAMGDGGAIITNNADIAERCRTIRHYGFDDTGSIALRGQNSRLSEIQAAILRVKLPHVHAWIERRQAIAWRYRAELPNVEHVQKRGVFHVYVVRHPERDRIRAALAERGIETMIHYPRPIHEHPRWQHLGYRGQFPGAEQLAREVLSLPMYPYLADEEQTAVIAALKEVT